MFFLLEVRLDKEDKVGNVVLAYPRVLSFFSGEFGALVTGYAFFCGLGTFIPVPKTKEKKNDTSLVKKVQQPKGYFS